MNGPTSTKRKEYKMNLKTNPELLPLVEWWEKDGKQTVIWVAVAAIAVAGWYGWKNHRAARLEAASDALVSAYTTEELEESVSKFSGMAAQGPIKIRLAKSYYDAGRYEEAMTVYDELAAKPVDGFEDIPVVGKAQCLEALGRYDEALAAFDAFVEANPSNYLALTAKLGAARCIAQAGDKAKALARIDEMKTAAKGDDIAIARIDATEAAIKRFEKKAPAAPAPAAPAVAAPAPAATEAAPAAK